MNSYLFGLTSGERQLLMRSTLPWKTYLHLTRCTSSFAPASTQPLKKSFYRSPTAISSKPPRYFFRGALDQRTSVPFTQFLTETNETPQPRPIPRNRGLLQALCRGKGVLRQNAAGHVYLEVDNRFILSLLPFLKSQGLTRPPYFNLFGTPASAHISIISSREAYFQSLGPLKEIGREYFFEIEGLYSSQPTIWPEVDQLWFFKIICPTLDQLRRCYFLPARPGGHSFMIAIAIKPSSIKIKAAAPILRISPCVTAA